METNDKTNIDIPEELNQMLDYLPLEYMDKTEKQYIDALTLAARTSYQNGLYQFAYVEYHMLFMTAVYYALLKVSVLYEAEMKKGLYYLLKDRYNDFFGQSNTKEGKLYFGSFAAIGESDVFMLFRCIGLKNDLLGELQKLVQQRNKYAHANGQLQLTSDELFVNELNNYNTKIKMIFALLKDELISFYKKTICGEDFYDPEIRAYLDPDEQIAQEFIKEYSVSLVELNLLRKIQLSEFDGVEGEEEIKTLHCALIHYYLELTRDDYMPITDTYIQNKYRNNAVDFIENELGISSYECGKDGVEFPLYECPECEEEQLVFDQENGKFHCFACDKDFTTDDLSFCERCGSLMRTNEDCPICQNCIDNMKQD